MIDENSLLNINYIMIINFIIFFDFSLVIIIERTLTNKQIMFQYTEITIPKVLHN